MYVIWNEQAKAYVGFKGLRSLLVAEREKAFTYPSYRDAHKACGIAERPLPLFN